MAHVRDFALGLLALVAVGLAVAALSSDPAGRSLQVASPASPAPASPAPSSPSGGPASPAGPPPASGAPAGPRVVFLGDAFVVGGAGRDQDRTFAAAAARDLGWDARYVGAPQIGYDRGNGRGDPMLAGFVPRVVEQRPQLVVVEGGLADVGYSAADVRSGAAQVLTMLRAGLPGVRLVVVGPGTRPGLSDRDARALRDGVRAAAGDVPGAVFLDPLESAWVAPEQVTADGSQLADDAAVERYRSAFVAGVRSLALPAMG